MPSFLLLILCVLITHIHCYRDGDIDEWVSPPFAATAYQAFRNPEIKTLLRDPENYNPSWGKTGVTYAVIYYIRNARLAVQYYIHKDIMIEGKNYEDIFYQMFKWEMDIFAAFRAWFDDNNNEEKWKNFVTTTYDIFGNDNNLKFYLSKFTNSNEISMPIYRDNVIGPKFLSVSDLNSALSSDKEFNEITPFIPSMMNDEKFPLIGFGSWTLSSDKCKDAVLSALKTGYRLIDTSENYNNEPVIGEAIIESGIERSKIMIASKLSYNKNYGSGDTTKAFYASLDRLGLTYMDVYMLHGAISDKERLKEAWLELEELYTKGKIKYIGVSNFGPRDMDFLMSFATIPPAFVQNKYDPFTQGQQAPWGDSIEEWVKNYNENVKRSEDPIMYVQGYCLFNSWPHQVSAVKDNHVRWIADKYHVNAAQLLIRWALQRKYIGVLTRSSQEERLLNNLNVMDFEINNVDMQLLNGLITIFSPFDVQWSHDVYGQVGNRPDLSRHQEL